MTTYNVDKNKSLSSKENQEFARIMNQKGVLTCGTPGDDIALRAFNSAPMISTPNINANLGVLNYIDPEAVEILTAPMTADKIVEPKKIGFWGLNSYTFNIKEHLGQVSPDDGSANDTIRSTSNVSQTIRGCKAFAGYWGNNDIAKAQYNQMKVNLQEEDVKSLMNALNINRNLVFFQGVKETFETQLPVYGFANDPNLPAYSVVEANNAGTSTQWKDKTPNEIANDICVTAYGALIRKSKNLVGVGSGKLKLVVSSSAAVYLNKQQAIGTQWINARKLIEETIKNIEIIECPELDAINNNSDVFYLIYEDRKFGSTVENLYVEMARAYPIFTHHSEISQKISQLLVGCVVKIPMFIVRYTGINDNNQVNNFDTYFN